MTCLNNDLFCSESGQISIYFSSSACEKFIFHPGKAIKDQLVEYFYYFRYIFGIRLDFWQKKRKKKKNVKNALGSWTVFTAWPLRLRNTLGIAKILHLAHITSSFAIGVHRCCQTRQSVCGIVYLTL